MKERDYLTRSLYPASASRVCSSSHNCMSWRVQCLVFLIVFL